MSGTDPMSLERFEKIANTYGGIVARWPAALRAEALRRSAEPEFVDALMRAAALDELLDSWVVPPPARGLADQIAIAASRRTSLASQARLWWSGIGVAATLAGAVAGAAAAATFAPSDLVSTEVNTVFGDLGGQEA